MLTCPIDETVRHLVGFLTRDSHAFADNGTGKAVSKKLLKQGKHKRSFNDCSLLFPWRCAPSTLYFSAVTVSDVYQATGYLLSGCGCWSGPLSGMFAGGSSS